MVLLHRTAFLLTLFLSSLWLSVDAAKSKAGTRAESGDTPKSEDEDETPKNDEGGDEDANAGSKAEDPKKDDDVKDDDVKEDEGDDDEEAPTPTAASLPATPLPATPLPATPLPATPLPATPLAATPLPATPLPATPLPATPLPATPLPATPPSATPLSESSSLQTDDDAPEDGESEAGGAGSGDDSDDDLNEDFDDIGITLDHLEPASGSFLGNQEIEAYGEGFPPYDEQFEETDLKPVQCFFGDVEAQVTSWDENFVRCISPPRDKGGEVMLTIKLRNSTDDDSGTSNSLAFTYTTSPIIEEIYPMVFDDFTKREDIAITVTGKNFKKDFLECKFILKRSKGLRPEVKGIPKYISEKKMVCSPEELILPSDLVTVAVSNSDPGDADAAEAAEAKWHEFSGKISFKDACLFYDSCYKCVNSECGYCFHTDECRSVNPDGSFFGETCTSYAWVQPKHTKECGSYESNGGWTGKGAIIGIGLLFGLGAFGGLAFFFARRYRSSSSDRASLGAAGGFGSQSRLPSEEQRPLRPGGQQWDSWNEQGDGWEERNTRQGRGGRGGRGSGRV